MRLPATPTMLFAVLALASCKPTTKDVAAAREQKNVAKLRDYLHHEVTELHVPALQALIDVAPEEVVRAEVQTLVTNSDAELLRVALSDWPVHPTVIDAAWNAALGSADADPFARVIASSPLEHRKALGTFAASRANDLRDVLAASTQGATKVESIVSALIELPLDTETLRTLAPILVAAAEKRFVAAPSAPTWTDVATYFNTTRKLQTQLDTQQVESMRCLTGNSFERLLPIIADMSERPGFDQSIRELASAFCEASRPRIARAILNTPALDIGTELGRKIEIIRGASCCWDTRSQECDAVPGRYTTRATCPTDDGYQWKVLRAPAYGFDPKYGPERDAAHLRSASDMLRVLDELNALPASIQMRARALISVLRDQADSEVNELAGPGEALALKDTIAALREERSRYLYLKGYIVANLGDNIYEMTTVLAVPSCASMACPTPPYLKEGKHSLLETSSTTFTTKGLFSIWAQKNGEKAVSTTDGFSETWGIFKEVDESVPKEVERRIESTQAELNEQIQTSATKVKPLEAQRKQLGQSMEVVERAVSASLSRESVETPP